MPKRATIRTEPEILDISTFFTLSNNNHRIHIHGDTFATFYVGNHYMFPHWLILS